jgi:hypothetical protein
LRRPKLEVNVEEEEVLLRQQRLITRSDDPHDTLGYNDAWLQSLNDHNADDVGTPSEECFVSRVFSP